MASLPATLPSHARQGHSPHQGTPRKADEQAAVLLRTPLPTRERSFQRDCVTMTHWDRSVEIIWRPSTTREMKTICSVASTCLKLVRYTERGRALDRACRLGEPKMDLLHHLRRRTHRRSGEGQGDLR